MTELEPCPHCGARPTVVHLHTSEPSPNVSAIRVICDVTRGGCGATGPQRMLEVVAVNAWNRRVPSVESVKVVSATPVSITFSYSSGEEQP